jgi:hypothetical protein
MTDNLISDLIKRYKYENSMEDFVKMKNSSFDILIVHEEEEMKEVFASKGNTVMYVRYHGNADINSVIGNIEKKIQIKPENMSFNNASY